MEEKGRKTEKTRDISKFAQKLHMPNFDQKSHIWVDGKKHVFFRVSIGRSGNGRSCWCRYGVTVLYAFNMVYSRFKGCLKCR